MEINLEKYSIKAIFTRAKLKAKAEVFLMSVNFSLDIFYYSLISFAFASDSFSVHRPLKVDFHEILDLNFILWVLSFIIRREGVKFL